MIIIKEGKTIFQQDEKDILIIAHLQKLFCKEEDSVNQGVIKPAEIYTLKEIEEGWRAHNGSKAISNDAFDTKDMPPNL